MRLLRSARPRATTPAPAALAALAAGLALAACGSGGAAAPASSAPSTSTTAPTAPGPRPTGPSVAQIRNSPTVTVGGRTVAVPTQAHGRPVSPVVDDGQTVLISAAGFLPHRLFSSPGVPVTWTNLTDQAQRIEFDNEPVRSPAIPPGGTWSWTTQSSLSVAYRSASGLTGVITVNPRILPGEDTTTTTAGSAAPAGRAGLEARVTG